MELGTVLPKSHSNIFKNTFILFLIKRADTRWNILKRAKARVIIFALDLNDFACDDITVIPGFMQLWPVLRVLLVSLSPNARTLHRHLSLASYSPPEAYRRLERNQERVGEGWGSECKGKGENNDIGWVSGTGTLGRELSDLGGRGFLQVFGDYLENLKNI